MGTVDAIQSASKSVPCARGTHQTLWQGEMQAIIPIISQVAGILADTLGKALQNLEPLFPVIAQVITQVVNAITPLIPMALNLVTALLPLSVPCARGTHAD